MFHHFGRARTVAAALALWAPHVAWSNVVVRTEPLAGCGSPRNLVNFSLESHAQPLVPARLPDLTVRSSRGFLPASSAKGEPDWFADRAVELDAPAAQTFMGRLARFAVPVVPAWFWGKTVGRTDLSSIATPDILGASYGCILMELTGPAFPLIQVAVPGSATLASGAFEGSALLAQR